MKRLALTLGFVWALPMTVLGIAVAMVFLTIGWLEDLPDERVASWRGMDQATGNVHLALVRGPLAEWLTRPRGPDGWRWSAITLGEVVLLWREPEETTIPHELAHVGQYRILGVLFLPVWLILTALVGYDRNPLERAARGAAGEVA